MKTRNIDRWVYNHSNKPMHYVRVKNPPKTPMEKRSRVQEARQQQFNFWCMRYGVYCGSYLPTDHRTLLRKGWKDTTHPNRRKHKPDTTEYTRKSTGQKIEHHDSKDGIDHHYHWFNNHSTGDVDYYFDRFGKPCKKKKRETHLAPLDRDFIWRKKK